MTDPIADFLTRIRNGIIARKEAIDVPFSKIKRRMADLLVTEGYIAEVTDREDETKQGVMTIKLKWDAQSRSSVEGLRRVSKPGQRVYVRADQVPSVRKGMGTAILSTSKGVLTSRAAAEQGIGGEVVCFVW